MSRVLKQQTTKPAARKSKKPETIEVATPSAPRRAFRFQLVRLRAEKGWSQSDLARELWGTVTDSRGYETAQHRDRISRWEKGEQVPTQSNLDLLAKVLGVTVDELAPDIVTKLDHGEPPAVSMTMVAGRPDTVRLVVNTFTSLAIASKVVALLAADPSTLSAAVSA